MIFNYKANTSNNTCIITNTTDNTIIGSCKIKNTSNNKDGQAWQVQIQDLIPDYPNKTFTIRPDSLNGTIDTDNIKQSKSSSNASKQAKESILDKAKKYLSDTEYLDFEKLHKKIVQQEEIASQNIALEIALKNLQKLGNLPKASDLTSLIANLQAQAQATTTTTTEKVDTTTANTQAVKHD